MLSDCGDARDSAHAAEATSAEPTAPRAPLRVAVVGAGYFAQFHYDGWVRNKDATVVALCDCDDEKARETAAKHDVAHVYADAATMLREIGPDILDIVTPPSTHLQLVQQAVKHKVPTVICQKPLADSLSEARKIVELAEQSEDTVLLVHENFRWQPWFREIRALLVSGAIGEVYLDRGGAGIWMTQCS